MEIEKSIFGNRGAVATTSKSSFSAAKNRISKFCENLTFREIDFFGFEENDVSRRRSLFENPPPVIAIYISILDFASNWVIKLHA